MIRPMDRYKHPGGMVTRPHNASQFTLLTEEFRMRGQQNGGDHTVRGNNSMATRNKSVLKSSTQNSESELQKHQLAAASCRVEQEGGNAKPLFGVRRTNVSNALPNTSPRTSGVDTELDKEWKRRARIYQEKSRGISVENENILDCVEINTNAVIGPQVNMPIQNTDTEAPIVQPNPKTSAIRCRPTPPPKPKKTFSMKTSELQDAPTDTDCLHDGGRMTIQAVGSPIMKTPHLRTVRSASPQTKPKSSSFVCESEKKGETIKTKESPKSMLLIGTEEVEHKSSCWLETSETESPYENVFPFQENVKPQVAATMLAEQTDVITQNVSERQQEDLLGCEATRQPITDAGNDGSPTTGTRVNPCDVAVESGLTVQHTEEILQERETAHKQELKEMEKIYKNKRKHLEDKYQEKIDEFKEWHEDKMKKLKQTYQNERDEQRRQLTEKFNQALAIQSAEAQAEKVRLLTSADQTRLNHQRQLVELQQEKEDLAHKVKQCDANIQQLLADKEANLQRQTDENQMTKAEKVRLLTTADQDHQRQLEELQQENKADILLLADKEAGLQRQKDKNQRAVQQLEASLQRHQNENERHIKLEATNYKDELTPYILTHLPELGEQQGFGSYGSVYRVQLNGICCIAKRIHDILLGQGGQEGVNLEGKRALYVKFYHECVLMSRIRHPNIVQFMGVHYGPQRDYGRELTLVMERLYMNLEECLKQYGNMEMWLKVSILLDVSQGLLYLHSRGVVHRDLTAPNVLLTTSFHAKIADLGVSRIIDVHPLAASKHSMIPGALGYMPPEALTEIPIYDSALDIFSFGVLILFVLLQEYPQFYDSYVTPEGLARKESHIQKRWKWINMLQSDDPFFQVICDCLQDVAAQRPTTNNLNYMLIQIAEMYPKPYKDIIDMQKLLQI